MLSIDECKSILKENDYDENVTDEQVASIRDFLSHIAMVQLNNNISKSKSYENN